MDLIYLIRETRTLIVLSFPSDLSSLKIESPPVRICDLHQPPVASPLRWAITEKWQNPVYKKSF